MIAWWLKIAGYCLGLLALLLPVSKIIDSRWLIVFQNTDEVRATGGFMGSYAIVDLGQKDFLDIQIRDMYDPSGISQSLPSPAGQQEYLSEGHGMKLVDANWSPDFPTSAQTILQYFANLPGDPQQFDGIVAVPLSTVERALTLIGGVYVPDWQTTVTGETLGILLRQDRDQFFPGSQEKTQSLQAFYAALKIKLSQLKDEDWQQFWQAVGEERLWQEIQFYSPHPKLEKFFDRAGVSGQLLPYSEDDIFLMPVESNVGINKANRKVTRSIDIASQDQQLTMTTTFQNAFTKAERPLPSNNRDVAVADHLSYVNYYRLLVRPDMQLESIRIDDKLVKDWDEEEIVGANGLPYQQIGFLVIVPEEETVEVQVKFNLPELTKPQLIFQRQIGIRYTDFVSSIE